MKRLLAPLLFLVAIATSAQTFPYDKRKFDLAVDFGLTYKDSITTVAQKYTTGQDTIALKEAWTICRLNGMPYSVFRTRYFFSAIMLQAAWKGNAAGPTALKYLQTWNKVKIPLGRFKSNVTLQIPHAGMTGEGSFDYNGNGGDQGFVCTEVVQDDVTWWPMMSAERRVFETPNASDPNTSGYNESVEINNIRVTGPGKKNDGVKRIGMFLGRLGECSFVNQLFATHFTYGFVVHGGVPLNFGTWSAFFNDIGFALLGTAQSTIGGMTMSGDNNWELVGMHPGYGFRAGGYFTVACIGKSEDGITNGREHMGQHLHFEGQYSVTIANLALHYALIQVDAAITINPVCYHPTTGAVEPQVSTLTVQGGGFGYSTIVHNLYTKKRWKAPGDNITFRFTHTSYQDRFESIIADLMPSSATNCSEPLGFLQHPQGQPVQGSFDYINCLPKKGSSTPPPVTTCTGWNAGTWGPCTNGTQTRTVTATPSGCTGNPPNKPAESQACSVAPVPIKWSSCDILPCSVNTVVTPREVLPGTKNPVNGVIITDAVFSDVGFGWVNERISISNGDLFLWTGVNTYQPIPEYQDLVAGYKYTITVPLPSLTLTFAVGNASNSAKMTATRWEYR